MNCTEFVQRVGLETALELLGDVVWEKSELSFEQWESFRRQTADLALQAKLLVKMTQTASKPDQLLIIWQLASDDSAVRLLATGKIREFVNSLTTFDQVQKKEPDTLWYEIAERHKELRAIWLQRRAELAKNLAEWYVVFRLAGMARDSDLKAQALAKIEQYAETFEDWKDLYRESVHGSPLRKRALANLARLAQSYEEWSTVEYFSINENDELNKRALSETIAQARIFDEWFSLFVRIEKKSAIHEWCQNKLVELAKTFDNWLAIYQSQSVKDLNIKASALKKMLELAKTFEHWRKIWSGTPEGSEVKAKARERLLSFVTLD